MGNYKNTTNRCGRKPPVKGHTNPKPRGVAHSEISVRTLDVSHKTSRHIEGIFHNKAVKNYIAVLDTGSQEYIIGIGG